MCESVHDKGEKYMAKFKKCPRCELNYIPVEKEYCDICLAELKGQEAFPELPDEDEAELCPRCKSNYLNEGEKYCEACQLEMEKEKDGRGRDDYWEEEPGIEDVEVDVEDIDLPDIGDDDDMESLEALAEEEAWDEDEEVEEIDDFEEIGDIDDLDLDDEEEDEYMGEEEDED